MEMWAVSTLISLENPAFGQLMKDKIIEGDDMVPMIFFELMCRFS